MQTQPIQSATVWVRNTPYSLDPMAYDYFGHHLAFTSSFAPLVSQYQRGAFVGIVAESWISSDDFKTWKFVIREGMTFSNDDIITPEAVLNSLKRVALLQKLAGSKSGLFERIAGLESLHTISDDLEGMRLEGRQLVLKFSQPIPELLGSVSFGLYAIAHPDDYDGKTGEWKDPRQAKTSGAYRVTDWTDDHLSLALHKGFPKDLRHPHPLPAIKILWNPQDVEKADIHQGDSFNQSHGHNFEFQTTSAATVSIAYIQCFTWRDKGSPCNYLNIRRLLRREFYREMEKKGFTPARSFFPQQLTDFSGAPEAIDQVEVNPSSAPYRILRSSRAYAPFSSAMEALDSAARTLKLVPEISEAPAAILAQLIGGALPEYPYDTATIVTGILIEDSRDARFMIQSKEGIRLPDPDGRLHEEASKPDLDYDKLEEILWDQAIIWPLAHFQAGLWVRKGSFDFSQINLDLPATDFSWIGMKK